MNFKFVDIEIYYKVYFFLCHNEESTATQLNVALIAENLRRHGYGVTGTEDTALIDVMLLTITCVIVAFFVV